MALPPPTPTRYLLMALYVVRHPDPNQAPLLRRLGFEVIDDTTPTSQGPTELSAAIHADQETS